MAEEKFLTWMETEVEPYLKSYRKQGYFRSYDGTSIFYYTYCIPEADRCIVISHGFCEFAEKYNEVIYHFLKAGYSVYIPEHRGHGFSDRKVKDIEKVHVKSYEEYVLDFTYFVQKVVEPREAHRVLFAHSMGGAIGALTIERTPQLFEAAILSAPMLGMKTGKYPVWVAGMAARINCLVGKGESYAAGQGGFRDVPDYEGSSCLSEERYRYVFCKRLQNAQYRTYGGTYAWVLAGIKATKALQKRKNLERIEIPVLLFEAGRDHMVDNDSLAPFAKGTKQTRLEYMAESKHEIFNAKEDTRQVYYQKIFEFLEKEENTNERKNEKA